MRILTPSLAVLPGISTYQLISDQRLRVSGDEPAVGYELNRAGIVTYQPARPTSPPVAARPLTILT